MTCVHVKCLNFQTEEPLVVLEFMLPTQLHPPHTRRMGENVCKILHITICKIILLMDWQWERENEDCIYLLYTKVSLQLSARLCTN